eukprot:TRINITY_DN61406_c0_g1_i1.p1 TRINITY_DN61406_c0_g1~~TRINITY_DN61406_c0_g1_i1.p1  ORF type:complete len:152 (-),score=21.49 TRINITY_DN61406_c0_g1_i1:91-510(-)
MAARGDNTGSPCWSPCGDVYRSPRSPDAFAGGEELSAAAHERQQKTIPSEGVASHGYMPFRSPLSMFRSTPSVGDDTAMLEAEGSDAAWRAGLQELTMLNEQITQLLPEIERLRQERRLKNYNPEKRIKELEAQLLMPH